MILKRIGHLCDYILFDEAWAGFMKFHPLYAGRFAMGLSGLDPDAPGIIATQSTHKQLASFSQASQIHIKDRHIRGQKRRIEHRRFNESFMQHASTSPFYPLFASLDVGAQMMKGRSGRSAVGRHDPARHRTAQEDPRGTARIRREGNASGTPLVLRAIRTRPGGDTRRGPRERRAQCRLGDDQYRPARHQSVLLAADAGRRLARIPRPDRGIRHDRPQQADDTDTRLRPCDGRLCRPRHPRPHRGAVSARKPHRGGEERPQLTVVPAHARRRGQQGRHA